MNADLNSNKSPSMKVILYATLQKKQRVMKIRYLTYVLWAIAKIYEKVNSTLRFNNILNSNIFRLRVDCYF